MRSIAHLNITGFRAAVSALSDISLRGRPFVIAGGTGGRAVAWDVSPQAMREGVTPGMDLSVARRLVKDLAVTPPDTEAYAKANALIEKIIDRYAPAWQNDGAGNIYLDITGTHRLFGPAPDCVCHIQNEILDDLKIEAAGAAGTNKLVCKVATRTIRPEGLIEVRAGDEPGFLFHQDVTLLPGIGPSILKTIRITGFREAGELASLTSGEALSLFGKKGVILRDNARGIDSSPVASPSGRKIKTGADFCEDVIDEEVIMGAIASICEHAGLEMRKEKLGTSTVNLSVMYTDGVTAEGTEKTKRLFVLDSDIISAAKKLYRKIIVRRIRIKSLCLSLEGLFPLTYEPDLFEPEAEAKSRSLQIAVDTIQERYGQGSVTRALVMKSRSHSRRRSIPARYG